MEILTQPWHWAFSGIMLVFIVFLLIFLGKRFGVSSSFKAICTIVAGRKTCDYFDYDWKSHTWLLMFVLGTIGGGVIANMFMANPNPVAISENTIQDLTELGIAPPQAEHLVPLDLFNFEVLQTVPGVLIFVVGGFLIGFGTRYAGGCTSGHAISGLSNLQLPSLVAVIGFFLGGIISTHVLLPLILSQ